jgi:ATP-binding cassette subfamily C protein
MLTLPIYLFQISDRVLTSRSFDTLLMLSLLALAFLSVLSVLDVFRRQVLGSLATRLDTRLGGPLLASVISSSTTGGGSIQTLRSLHQVRNFISSPAMLLLFDTPLAPVYFAVVFLISPTLGFIVLASGIILIGIAWLNQNATSGELALAGAHAIKADQHAEALARNSQVINAMGMLNESILHWGREEANALTRQSAALDRNFWISGLSKYFRLITQIAVLGVGAYLALEGKLTAGMMIAASIIGARALQPLEGMIEGWRSIVQTRVSYASRRRRSRSPAAREAAPAPAAPRWASVCRPSAVSAARQQGARAQWRQLRAGTGRVAGRGRSLGLRQVDARPPAGRVPDADCGQSATRRHRAAQLGSAPVRRVHRLPAAGGGAVPRHHPPERLPHA